MMVLKKKEIIAATLVVMIGVAGYLNWSYQDTIRVTDGEIYTETGKRLGEAQYVSTTQENIEDKAEDKDSAKKEEKKDTEKSVETSVENHFASARIEKENARSKSLEILNQTASNESFDDDTRKKAQERILKLAENIEKEATIENIAKAKGFSEISVYIDGDQVDMLVKKDNFSENDAIKLKDIASEQLGVSATNIKIVQVQ